MARTIRKLTAMQVARAAGRGKYLSDGGGLYLQLSATGSRSWVYRYRDGGRRREMGLGPLHTISLAEAREKALECRKLRLESIDPITARRDRRMAAKLDAAKAMTFKECAERYLAAHRTGWRSGKHAAQWISSLGMYVYPVLGDLPVQAIGVSLIMKILEPLWAAKAETASRVRGRIEAVLDWAAARGYRQGENPARWRGHLENLLPKRSRVRRIKHHPALPYAEIAVFMAELRQQQGVAARALEFTILTGARSGEVMGARWDEINRSERLWTIPAAL